MMGGGEGPQRGTGLLVITSLSLSVFSCVSPCTTLVPSVHRGAGKDRLSVFLWLLFSPSSLSLSLSLFLCWFLSKPVREMKARDKSCCPQLALLRPRLLFFFLPRNFTPTSGWAGRVTWLIGQMDSWTPNFQFQFFISIHTEQYNFLLFIELSLSLIILQKINLCFHQIFHDSVFINMHVLWK